MYIFIFTNSTHKQMDRCMEGWMDGWMDGLIDKYDY